MFQIEFTPEAIDDLQAFAMHDRQIVMTAIEKRLPRQPTQETRNRKRLRPNQVSEWELRVGDYRVFYDADEASQMVKVVAVGYKKGGQLCIHGQEIQLRPHDATDETESHEDSDDHGGEQ